MMFVNEKLQEFERYIKNRKVALIGLGVSNLPLIDYFADKGAQVTVFDKRSIDEIDKDLLNKITTRCINFSFGEHNLISLIGFDLILRSPSCKPDLPELKAEEVRGAIVTSEIELVIEMCPGKVIGVTGSDGKTTTASLIHDILRERGYTCYLGGNIGTPLFTKLEEMRPDCVAIYELSSVQLMGMQTSPEIAVITNVAPNHLDTHEDYEEYINCIKNIYRYQDENGKVVLNYDNDITREFAADAPGKARFFSAKSKMDNGVIYDNGVLKSCVDGVRMHIMTIDDAISVQGMHNYQNICAAIAATEDIVDPYSQLRAITKFNGLEHRLEFVQNINGVKWYNDSLGTTPSRTTAGLKTFKEKSVLIAGGYDKNLDYEPLAKPILQKVSKLILMGSTADKIEEAVKNQIEKDFEELVENARINPTIPTSAIKRAELPIYRCSTLEECVQKANELAAKNEVVLFSPASESFDMYKNFAERGEKFKSLVLSLDKGNTLKNPVQRLIGNTTANVDENIIQNTVANDAESVIQEEN
jgi:UDP-N-acetylmuramoylalanine--D-glutamate ligase